MNLLAVATLVAGLASALDPPPNPLLCTTGAPPVVYNLPVVNPCETGPMNSTAIIVTYMKPIHTSIVGWRIRAVEVTCTSHYFFWGSYTSSLTYHRPREVDFPDMSLGIVCPPESYRFVHEDRLQEDLCKFTWPTSRETTTLVCYVEKATLLSFEGVTTVDGIPVRKCSDNTCQISSSEMFYHSKGSIPNDTERVIHYAGKASCNSQLCVIPSLKEVYPILQVSKTLPNGSFHYRSLSGTNVWVDKPGQAEAKGEGEAPIADATILAKIASLDVSVEALEKEVSHICHGLKTLYSSILALSRSAPSTAAALYLNRTDLHAVYVSGHLLVWPCVEVDEWKIRPTSECTAYIPIDFNTLRGSMSGYLDTSSNRVYLSSPAADCGSQYLIRKGELWELHQRRGNVSVLTSSPLKSQDTGSIFKKIVMKASGWTSSSSSMYISKPREFSYEDLERPIGGGGREWLDIEMDKKYPLVNYLSHLKTTTVLLTFLCVTYGYFAAVIIVHLRNRVRRVEETVTEMLIHSP
ncbi:MAG: hypothetical protein QKV08_gp4 [Sanya nyamivirus 1]|uniref:Glycoprotein n=2 Tax=Nyamiviridae TaxID=1513294 RepID=A0A8K1XGM5_9MONO|nr:MAG: hypothetical protein QKV08_gp4 [Sanya nyamivirus 1]UHM27506.1 MAG: hypothetical protein SaNyV1_gp4 [Sanya nyamivirus 1]